MVLFKCKEVYAAVAKGLVMTLAYTKEEEVSSLLGRGIKKSMGTCDFLTCTIFATACVLCNCVCTV